MRPQSAQVSQRRENKTQRRKRQSRNQIHLKTVSIAVKLNTRNRRTTSEKSSASAMAATAQTATIAVLKCISFNKPTTISKQTEWPFVSNAFSDFYQPARNTVEQNETMIVGVRRRKAHATIPHNRDRQQKQSKT